MASFEIELMSGCTMGMTFYGARRHCCYVTDVLGEQRSVLRYLMITQQVPNLDKTWVTKIVKVSANLSTCFITYLYITLVLNFFSIATTCPFLTYRLWPKCNRLLRLGRS
jgi:hypothetical protein